MLPGGVVPYRVPTSLSDALDQSVVAPIFCVEMTCGRFEPIWLDAIAPVYYLPQVDEVVAVKHNDVAMTQVFTSGDLAATPNTWAWLTDSIGVHLTADANPNAPENIIETFLVYRVSDGPTDAGGYWWEPRLVDLPSLGSRIPTDFKGVVQIGGGSLTLANEDAFFQPRMGQDWDAGTTTIKMGAAGLAWVDFETLATFSNISASLDDTHFVLSVKEAKADTDAQYPTELYGTDEFPSMRPEDVGRAKQLAYGFVQDVNPVCIDQGAIEFQVAAHSIYSFEGVRVFDQTAGTWNEVNFGSTDLVNAKFTLDSLTWQPGIQVAVDFYGRKNADDSLMANPADVVEDLLTLAGYAVDSTSNAVARDWLRMGYTGAVQNDLRCVALYLDAPTNILQQVEEIGFNARCYFVSSPTGELYMLPWRTYRASTVERVTDIDCLKPGLRRDILAGVNGFKASQIAVNFAKRPSAGSSSQVTAESVLSQYTRDRGAPVAKTYESLLWKQRDANYLCQSLLAEEQFDALTYSLKLKWRPFKWRPGQHLNLVLETQALNVLAEILEVRMNLTSRSVDLKLGNLRGFDQATGFWSDVADVCPDGASMVWAQDSQKDYRRHETGIWHNTKNQATDTPVDRSDWSVSRWI